MLTPNDGIEGFTLANCRRTEKPRRYRSEVNADGGAGGVGAQLTPAQDADSSLAPGASETVQFAIGLQGQEPFTFFVNMRGDAR